jgi:hypothetical protein
MPLDLGPALAPDLHLGGEGPQQNPRRRRRQGTLILPCDGAGWLASLTPSSDDSLINTTLGNGYLGSRIDEERSKMRYLV